MDYWVETINSSRPGLRMAVLLHVKVRGRAWTAVYRLYACSVRDTQCRCSSGKRLVALYKWLSVMPFTLLQYALKMWAFTNLSSFSSERYNCAGVAPEQRLQELATSPVTWLSESVSESSRRLQQTVKPIRLITMQSQHRCLLLSLIMIMNVNVCNSCDFSWRNLKENCWYQ